MRTPHEYGYSVPLVSGLEGFHVSSPSHSLSPSAPFFKESGRLSASRRREEELTTSERAEHHPLHPSNGAMHRWEGFVTLTSGLWSLDFDPHSHTFSAPVHTVSQSPTHSSNSRKSPLLPHTPTSSPNSPLHTTTIATIEEHPSPEAPPITTPSSTYSRSVSPSSRMSPPGVRVEMEPGEGVKYSRLGSPLLSKLSPLLGGKKGRSAKTRELSHFCSKLSWQKVKEV